MRSLTSPIAARIAAALRRRDWFGIAVEVFAVVLGVVLGLQATAWVEGREERAYRAQIIATLDTVLNRFVDRGSQLADNIDRQIAGFEAARARGDRPPPPLYIETERGQFSAERPPTAVWSAVVATGVARSLDPDQMLRLTLFFDRADSFGDRYMRYNAISEARIIPYRDDPDRFYGSDGRLDPLIADHLDQLRGIAGAAREMARQASELERELSSARTN